MIEMVPIQSKKLKRSESRKKRRNVPLLLERMETLGVGHLEASAVGKDEEDPLALEESEEEYLEIALWSSRLRLLILKGKDHIEIRWLTITEMSLTPLRTTREMTPEDMMESFVINSVRVCLAYHVYIYITKVILLM